MTRTAEEAIAWAKGYLGQYGWDNLCLSFVRQSFGIDYVGDWPTSSRMAGTAWDRAKRRHSTTDPFSIPAGVPVFFELATQADHVVLKSAPVGVDQAIGNDFVVNGRIDYNKIADISARWGRLLGWTEDLVGNTIWTPKPVVVSERKKIRVKAAHVSMQYSDTPAQMTHDAEKIFTRAQKRGFWWVTGTEADGEQLGPILRDVADRFGYRFHRERGEWVAVDKNRIKGNWTTGFAMAITSQQGTGRHTDRGVAWVAFDSVLGRITVGAGHYLTDGRGPGDPNWDENRAISKVIATWAAKHGEGSALVFYGGDQNINDRTDDTFHGGPMTTAADELRKWQNTGHGPIDVIASYDRDGRVEAVRWNALDDTELQLHTDHFFTAGVFDVLELAA